MARVTTAMILAAGRGERLRPLTDRVPKPLLLVRGQPLLAHQLGWLKAAGITNLVINLHHLGEQIEAYCGNGSVHGLQIQYSHEPTLLETGGGVQKALPLLGNKPFLLLNGDIFTSFNLSELSDIPDWADVHLLLTPTPAFRTAGDFLYADGRVLERGGDHVYCGIAVLRPGLFQQRRAGAFSLRELFFEAAAAGRASAQLWCGDWTDIGSRDQLEAINRGNR